MTITFLIYNNTDSCFFNTANGYICPFGKYCYPMVLNFGKMQWKILEEFVFSATVFGLFFHLTIRKFSITIMISNQSYLIAGCGVSGRAAARLASSLNLCYSVLDEKDTPEMRDFFSSLSTPPKQLFFGWNTSMCLPHFSSVVISPGIRETNPLFSALLACSDTMISEPGFALRFTDCPSIAITGTNGKTTTTEITACLLQACGFRALASGNIGYGLSDAVMKARAGEADVLVIEISSFQLERIGEYIPDCAAVLNLASDHLDRHGSMDAYARLKFSLCRHPETKTVFGRSLDAYREKYFPAGREYTLFSSAENDSAADFSLSADDVIRYRGKNWMDCSGLHLRGKHNMENIMAALALIAAWKGQDILDRSELKDALLRFQPDAHRVELFLEKNGIRYVNDSKATNPHAVNAALDEFPEPGRVILLLGGLDKDMLFEEMLPHSKPVKQAFLFGECASKMMRVFSDVFPCCLCDTFEDAVKRACASAVPGDTVMLSPATASMDMFKNYRERGDKFKELVRKYASGK